MSGYERPVEQFFHMRDASTPGSPEEDADAAKVLEAVFDVLSTTGWSRSVLD